MQVPLYTREGAAPKRRLNIVSAVLVCALAVPLPVRARIAFAFAINFIYNHILATSRLVLAFVGRQLTHALIFLTYVLVLGPVALAARLLGRDYLGAREEPRWLEKEPPDAADERFQRQF
jgi:hypothetical protein